tara:strand:- start:941 stop:1303 length:363 start_codon:yes stop_codon:yes gene_type:complete
MFYCYELISLLNLSVGNNYSRELIFNLIKKKKVKKVGGLKYNLWKLDSKFLDIIMDYNLINTKIKFYDLFYLNSIKWRKHYKIGFTKIMILKMIDSLSIKKYKPLFIYNFTGKNIKKIII